jgi:hypothetical protein
MAVHKRYQGSGEVPDIRGTFHSPFSIGSNFKDGRAAYLDCWATTSLDRRVLDAIMKVKRKYLLF